MILQASLPFAPWMDPRTRRLPGIVPLDLKDWLQVDDAYSAQLARKAELLSTQESQVLAMLPEAQESVAELYDFALEHLPKGFAREGNQITRPDGAVVALDSDRPLWTLGHLLQEDLCIMLPDGQGEHQLAAAILCFPAGWSLEEKLGRPLMRMHRPVQAYTEDLGRRVQRLMDGVRVGAPLWRANAHHSRAPLFNPRREAQGTESSPELEMPYIRSERQCLLRLPQSQAVVFSIHTYLVRLEALTGPQAEALEAFPLHRA